MKYNFTYNYTDNAFVDSIIYTNVNVKGFLIYVFVLAFFIVLTYVFIKRTDDVPLSLVRSTFATTMISILFYYMGKSYGVDLFNGNFLVTMILVLAFSIGALYYNRHQVNG
jgi:hypothetical protein